MKGMAWLAAVVVLGGAGVLGFACGGKAGGNEQGRDGGDVGGDAATVEASEDAGVSCTPCASDGDCHGTTCVTVPGGNFCASTCSTSTDCSSDTTCTPVNSVASGAQIGACVPRGGECGVAPTGDGAAPATCGQLAGPSTTAGCACPSGKTCNANGCRYQDYCDTTSNTCVPAPIGCGTPGAAYDGGAAPTGSVGADGGTVSRLYFAVVGDTRPPDEDETAS
ncbi:MAG TPA: hypothetical protein VIY73_14305, partial [Polyangiaceae bacterium]